MHGSGVGSGSGSSHGGGVLLVQVFGVLFLERPLLGLLLFFGVLLRLFGVVLLPEHEQSLPLPLNEAASLKAKTATKTANKSTTRMLIV